MTMEKFVEEALQIALANGCDAAEAYFVDGDKFEVSVLDGKLDTYSVSLSSALNLRVKYGGKDGYACTERIVDPASLVKRAIDNAKSIENEDESPMQGPSAYREITQEKSPIIDMSDAERIELAYSLERRVKAEDARVARVISCNVGAFSGNTHIRNTLGLCADKFETEAVIYVEPVVEEKGESRDGFAFRSGPEAADVEGCAREAVKEAVDMLGAAPVPQGEYRVLLRYDAAAALLAAFFPMFSADAAQKGLSLLANKEGERIASERVTLLDDPFHAFSPRAFDAEGVPSLTKTVIENGVLMTLLHNLKTAKKAEVASTGNAGRGGVFSPVSVMPTNFHIQNGTTDFDGLMKHLDNGLFITDLAGMHAGVNTVSGEFSLLAKGRLVASGAIVRPVEQITVSGSFLQLMNSIIDIGNDLRFSIPRDGNIGSPSLLVSSLTIAGK